MTPKQVILVSVVVVMVATFILCFAENRFGGFALWRISGKAKALLVIVWIVALYFLYDSTGD